MNNINLQNLAARKQSLLCAALVLTAFAPDGVHAAVTGTRPLVTVLTQWAGETAEPDEQWLDFPSGAGVATIPAGPGGVVTQTVAPAIPACGASGPYGLKIANIWINHPRHADLLLTVYAADSRGGTVRSQVLFDGPSEAKGKSADEIAAIRMKAAYDADSLIFSAQCAQIQFQVTNTGATTGVLSSWNLRFRRAWSSFGHDAKYYRRLLFGGGGQYPVVNDYFAELSRRSFRFSDAGIYGPVTWDAWRQSEFKNEAKVTAVIHSLEDQGFDFAQYDRDLNGEIRSHELTIIDFDNTAEVGGGNRHGPGDCVQLQRSQIRYCGDIVLMPHRGDFATIAHELAHTMGAVDLYGVWGKECRSQNLTLMSCTIKVDNPDDPASYYLDPWHRRLFAWLSYTPLIVGANELGSEAWRDPRDRQEGYAWPGVLRNPKNAKEYFLFEYRTGEGYDYGIRPESGVVIWHIESEDKRDGLSIYAVSPGNAKGGSQPWNEWDGRFRLNWADGSLVPYVFLVEQSSRANAISLRMDEAPAQYRPPDVQIVRPADGSSGPYGLGNNVVFEARVNDPQTGSNDLQIVWSSDRGDRMGQGAQVTYAFVNPGTYKITVTATNRFGLSTAKSITYTANRVAPTVQILSPAANASFVRNQKIRLAAVASTPSQFAIPCDRVVWSADRVPSWRPAVTLQNGQCVAEGSFDLTGALRLTVTATDDFSQSASASVSITLTQPAPNSPPVVTITSPAAGTVMYANIRYRISGSVVDPDNAGPVYYRWTVYQPSTGTRFEDRISSEIKISSELSFDWQPDQWVSPGTIEIRLYGTNSRGDTTRASQTFRVLGPPR